MRRAILAGLILSGFAAFVVAALAQIPSEELDAKQLLADAKAHFKPLPPPPDASDPAMVARIDLGRHLFFETRLSADSHVSCAHCHQPERQAADGLAKAVGVFGKENERNTPTIFNASLNFSQNWRGEQNSMEDVAEKSLLEAAIFGNQDLAAPIERLKTIPAYGPAFAQAFVGDREPFTSKNWSLAIADYERTLLTPSKFDAFLRGDLKALTGAEQAGLRKFIDLGCANCHKGAGIGGTSMQKFGVHTAYWTETGVETPSKGRAELSKRAADLFMFKVPSLRNVAKTAPYFHDGSVADLKRAVIIMGKVQLGVDMSGTDADSIVAFLGALTGPVPANFSAPEPYPDVPPPH